MDKDGNVSVYLRPFIVLGLDESILIVQNPCGIKTLQQSCDTLQFVHEEAPSLHRILKKDGGVYSSLRCAESCSA